MASVAMPRSLCMRFDDVATKLALDCLSVVLDQFTCARLAQAGISSGWRCLIVSAGNGSIARWLGEVIGSNGEVVATTTAPQHLLPYTGVEVLALDIASDALPDGSFDLIYARLALAPLPTRREVLVRLAALLIPGGVLLVEEWVWSAKVLAAPDPVASVLFDRYQQALTKLLAAQGHDNGWAERVPAAMLNAGLVGVDAAVHARSWAGGTPGTKLPLIVASSLHGELIEVGMGGHDLGRLCELLVDPRLLLLSNPTFSTIGRRLRVTERAAGVQRPGGALSRAAVHRQFAEEDPWPGQLS